jgi:hypothetical protein
MRMKSLKKENCRSYAENGKLCRDYIEEENCRSYAEDEKLCRGYDEDEKHCRGYDEDDSSVEIIVRRKTVEAMMKT